MATPVVTSITLGELEVRLAQAVGDCAAQGVTSTTGAANTLVDAIAGSSGLAQYFTDNHPALYRKLVTIFKGTRAGDSTGISAFTASTRALTPSPNFGGNLAADSEYFIHGRWTHQQFLEGLRKAYRGLIYDPDSHRGVMKESVTEEIVIGNALINGTMARWTNGTSAAPDGWTLAGTGAAVAQESTITLVGKYSAKVTSDGTNAAYLYQSVTPLSRFRGRNVRLVAIFMADVASRATVRLGQGNSGSITTIGTAETAVAANTVYFADLSNAFDTAVTSLPPTSLTLQFGISAGSAVNMYCGLGYLEDPEPRLEYPIDSDENLVVLDGTLYVSEPIGRASGGALAFNDFVGPNYWSIVQDTTRRIKLPRDTSTRRLCVVRATGWKNHAALAAVTTTWAGPIDAIVDLAAAHLHSQKVAPQQQPSLAGAPSPQNLAGPEAVRQAVLRRDGIIVKNPKVVEPIR